jgi:hypothetical protein
MPETPTPIPAPVGAVYAVPEGQILLPEDLVRELVETRRMNAATDAQQAKLAEANFCGTHNAQRLATAEIEAAYGRLARANEEIVKYQEKVAERDKIIADMTRTSEDAKLETMKIEASIRSKDADLDALRLKLDAEHKDYIALLGSLKPLMQGGGVALGGLLKNFLEKNVGGLGLPGSAPPGASSATSSKTQNTAPTSKFEMISEGAEEWRSILLEAIPMLKPETIVKARALAAIGVHKLTGGEAGPVMDDKEVLAAVVQDIGQELAMKFYGNTANAWTEVSAPAEAASNVNVN